jgi:Leucine-rich repeat (LRR) protein
LEQLPSALEKLTQLETLSLSRNPLNAEAIEAAHLDRLKNLQWLYLAALGLDRVPACICRMSK